MDFRRLHSARKILAAWTLVFCLVNSGKAQDIWEFSPYDIHVWVATGGSAEFGDVLNADIQRTIAGRCEASIRAPWKLNIAKAPAEIEAEMLSRMESLQPTDVLELSREVALADKLFLVAVVGEYDTTRIQVREFDSRSREFGNIVERSMGDLTQVGHQSFAALLAAFRPIAKIVSTKDRDKMVAMRVRAAGLATSPDSPILIKPGTLIQPYVRNNDRNGEPTKKLGIQKTPWTYCLVTKLEDPDDRSIINCEIYSGTRVPVSGRPNQRIQRFAIVMPATPGMTTLVLQSTAKRPEPLSGYDIYAKDPLTDKQELLGRTDWRGTMEIPTSENPLRLVYVRNGAQLLARLPIIPGLERTRTVQITSDDLRLQVEGLTAGMQSWIMDVVAHRELLKQRFHKRLQDKKLPEAKKLLDEYATVDSRDTIEKILNLEHARRRSEYETVNKKIDKLFETTRGLLTKHVNPDEGSHLIAEFEEARGGETITAAPKASAAGAPGAAREVGSPDPPKTP